MMVPDPLRCQVDDRLHLGEVAIFRTEARQERFDHLRDPLARGAVTNEVDAHHGQASRVVFAVPPVEEEVNRRQHVFGCECLDDLPGRWLGFLHLAAPFGGKRSPGQ